MPDPTLSIATSPDVVFTRLDDAQGVLLHLRTQRYYSLNETGAAIWELLAEPMSAAEVAAALCARFEVEEDAALGYVQQFVAQLREDGLVQAA